MHLKEDPHFATLAKKTLASIWKYVVPYRGRFALSVLLGMLSAVFNDFMLIGFQLIFSLVLKGKTRTLGEGTELPLVGEINLAKMFGLDADAPIGDQGRILDRGPHGELLSRNTLYQKLYHLQFSSDNRHES
jgi:hypothetical protein